MKQAIKELLESKKFLAAILAIVVWAVGRLGIDMSTEQLAPIVGSLWTYIVGQAIADHGKSKAKIENSE